jgi:valyl-tRNA synthetase
MFDLSEQRIAGYRNFVTKITNAYKFAEFKSVYPLENIESKSQNTFLISGSFMNFKFYIDQFNKIIKLLFS